MPPSRDICSRLASSCASLGWTVKPSGGRTCARPMRSSIAAVDGGLPADHHAGVLELRLRALEARDRLGSGGGGRVAVLAGLGEHPLELRLVVLQRLLGLVERDVAAADERLGVELAHRALGLDEVVHQRLRHRGVVALVVTAAAVADHVDDDVAVELLAVLERELGDAHARLGVVPVDVEDRHLQALGHVGAVLRRARRRRPGGEADLVVDDHVDRCRRCGSRAAAPG